MESNDIIKALEDWIKNYDGSYVNFKILGNALDLITRQQAKIEEFMKETAITTLIEDAVVYTPTLEDYNKFKKKFKTEAYKEFAERVKEFMHNKFKALDEYEFEYITERDLDNLLKEKAGENND